MQKRSAACVHDSGTKSFCIGKRWILKAFKGLRHFPKNEIRELMTVFQACSACSLANVPQQAGIHADGEFGLARILAFAGMFVDAAGFAKSAQQHYSEVKGLEYHQKCAELALAAILSELGEEPPKQVALLEEFIRYSEQHQPTDRIAWWKERAMTQLAEAHYRQGDHQEADHLYAEVRSSLPKESDHDIVGWCKSWCDRHEARQLMEKGDWDGAYSKILLARVGTIDYGHRNLSKGLTMERILRMSAEIQRNRGNHKEADEDLEYADLIARHAEKLRTALEAELQNFHEPDPDPTPQG